MFLLHVLHGVAPGKPAAQAHLHVLVGAQSRSAAAAERLLADRVFRHLEEVVADVPENVARLLEEAHDAGRIAGVVERHPVVVVAAGVQLQFAVVDQVGDELHDVDHLGGPGVLEDRAGDRRDRHFQEIGRAVHGVHVLVQHPPHVAALAAEDPLDPQPLGLGVDLGVQPFDHFVRGEQAEVAALGGIGAEGVVQAQLVEQEHVAHAGVDARVGDEIARRR